MLLVFFCILEVVYDSRCLYLLLMWLFWLYIFNVVVLFWWVKVLNVLCIMVVMCLLMSNMLFLMVFEFGNLLCVISLVICLILLFICFILVMVLEMVIIKCRLLVVGWCFVIMCKYFLLIWIFMELIFKLFNIIFLVRVVWLCFIVFNVFISCCLILFFMVNIELCKFFNLILNVFEICVFKVICCMVFFFCSVSIMNNDN